MMMSDRERRDAEDLERLADATDRLAISTDSLLDEVKGLARHEANQVVRRSQRRQRALLASSVWSALAAVMLAVLISSTLIDVHVHRGHVEPIESRLTNIEALIAEVDDTIGAGMLPDLDGERFATASAAPLAPADEQDAPPVGVIIYGAGALVLLGCLAAWGRARRQLTGTRDT
jgi:hypothetical protein